MIVLRAATDRAVGRLVTTGGVPDGVELRPAA